MRRYDYVPYGGSCEVKDDKGVRVERAEYFVLASDFDEYKRGAEALLRECRELVVNMDKWNTDVQKIIGRVPNTGFERAGDILADIDSWLEKGE